MLRKLNSINWRSYCKNIRKKYPIVLKNTDSKKTINFIILLNVYQIIKNDTL